MKHQKHESQRWSSLKETVVRGIGVRAYEQLDMSTKKGINEIDKLRRISEKKNISLEDLTPA